MYGRYFGRDPVPRPFSLNLNLKVKCKVKVPECISCPERLATAWDYFGTRADVVSWWYRYGTPLFDLEFDLEGEMPRQRSWLCKLLGRLAIVWDHFGIPAHVISWLYPVRQIPVIWPGIWPWRSNASWKAWLHKLPRDASCHLQVFQLALWRNLGTISGTRPLTLNWTLKVKCLKGRGRVCCPGGLAIIWNHFGTSAGVN